MYGQEWAGWSPRSLDFHGDGDELLVRSVIAEQRQADGQTVDLRQGQAQLGPTGVAGDGGEGAVAEAQSVAGRNGLTQRGRWPYGGGEADDRFAVLEHLVHTSVDGVAAGLGGGDLLVGYGAGGDVAIGYLEAHGGVGGVEPVADGLPRFAALENLLVSRPLLKAGRREGFAGAVIEQGGDGFDGVIQCLTHIGLGKDEGRPRQ